MSSILTNVTALTALQNLASTNKSLAGVQGRISTGMRISEASDNAAYWSIATSMRSDNKANSAVQDALGLGSGKVDTAYAAMNDVKNQIVEMKTILVTAYGASQADQQKIADQIATFQGQIKTSANNANYAGSNLLVSDGSAQADLNVIASYNRQGASVTVDTVNVTAASTQVLSTDGTGGIAGAIIAADFFNPSDAAVADDAIKAAFETLETALQKITTGAAKLGAAKSRIDTQKEFISKLIDSVEKGIGSLVDADIDRESARLSALQVQQQLSVQALSIANNASQNILSLFR